MKIDDALSVMIFLDLDYDLTNEVKDYYKVTEIKKEIMDSYDGLLDLISPSLKLVISA